MAMGNELRAFLQEVELFSALSSEQLLKIVQILRPQQAKPGEILFRAGDRGDAAYIIYQGGVEIYNNAEGRSITIARLDSGAVFGELNLIDGAPRSASARAMLPTRLLLLDKARFDEMRQDLDPTAYLILRILSNQLCDRIRETNEQIESTLEGRDVGLRGASLASSARIQRAKPSFWQRLFNRCMRVMSRLVIRMKLLVCMYIRTLPQERTSNRKNFNV